MLLVANGCSMTIGEELGGERRDKDGVKLGDIDPAYKAAHAWPARLAAHLECDFVNLAQGGASNDRILRTTIEWMARYINLGGNPEELFVVVGWSSSSRAEYRVDNRWVDLFPQWEPPEKSIHRVHVMHRDYIMDEIRDHTKTIQAILSLQSWLKAHKVPYLFFNALQIIYDTDAIEVKDMLRMVDKRRYINFDDQMFSMHGACRQYPLGPRQHPLAKGHQAWADHLNNQIALHSLLSRDT